MFVKKLIFPAVLLTAASLVTPAAAQQTSASQPNIEIRRDNAAHAGTVDSQINKLDVVPYQGCPATTVSEFVSNVDDNIRVFRKDQSTRTREIAHP